MKNIAIFLVCFSKFAIGQPSVSQNKGKVVIYYTPSEKAFFYHPDPFQRNKIYDLSLSYSGKNHISVAISQPFDVLYFSSGIAEPLAPVLVCDGDTIKVNKNKLKYTFYGKNQNELNALSLIEEKYGLTFSTSIQFSKKTNFYYFLEETKNKYLEKIKVMDSIFYNSPKQRWLKAEIINRYLIDLLMPYCGEYNMFSFEDIPKFYVQKVDSICSDYLRKNPNLFSSSSGRTFLWTFNKFNAAVKYQKSPVKDWNKLYLISKSDKYSENTRDYLSTRVIREWGLDEPINKKNIINLYLYKQPDNLYKNILIKEMAEELNEINTHSYILEDSQEQPINFDKIIKENTNILYIDFWASWCGPCLNEMPNSKMLKEKYIKKGVEFLYLSIDKDKISWKITGKKVGLSDSESYLLIDDEESEIVKQLKISSIPRYLIIGKDGKVINADAPRPSDPKIGELFDELLKK